MHNDTHNKNNKHSSRTKLNKLANILCFIVVLLMFSLGSYYLISDAIYNKNVSSIKSETNSNARFQTEVIDQSSATLEEKLVTSLDPEYIHSLPLPKGYRLNSTQSNIPYMDNYPEIMYEYAKTDNYLTPEISELEKEELVYSSIEDDMIYTLTKATYVDNSEGTILYINNPITLNFVACNITQNNGMSNLYTFFY